MVCHNPHITGYYNSLYTLNKQRFGWLWARAAPLPYAVYMGIYNTKWLPVHY